MPNKFPKVTKTIKTSLVEDTRKYLGGQIEEFQNAENKLVHKL